MWQMTAAQWWRRLVSFEGARKLRALQMMFRIWQGYSNAGVNGILPHGCFCFVLFSQVLLLGGEWCRNTVKWLYCFLIVVRRGSVNLFTHGKCVSHWKILSWTLTRVAYAKFMFYCFKTLSHTESFLTLTAEKKTSGKMKTKLHKCMKIKNNCKIVNWGEVHLYH